MVLTFQCCPGSWLNPHPEAWDGRAWWKAAGLWETWAWIRLLPQPRWAVTWAGFLNLPGHLLLRKTGPMLITWQDSCGEHMPSRCKLPGSGGALAEWWLAHHCLGEFKLPSRLTGLQGPRVSSLLWPISYSACHPPAEDWSIPSLSLEDTGSKQMFAEAQFRVLRRFF